MENEKEKLMLQIMEMKLKLAELRNGEKGKNKEKYKHSCPICGETWYGWKENIVECYFCKRNIVKKEGKREKEVERELEGLNLEELERSSPECRYGERLNCLSCGSAVIADKKVILGKEWDIVECRCGDCHERSFYRRKKQVKAVVEVKTKFAEKAEDEFEEEEEELTTELTEEMDPIEQADVFGIEG